MNNRLKNILSTFILIAIILASILCVSRLLESKASNHMYASYIDEEQPIDVLILGNSHVRHTVFPMEFWGKYGISAYNLAGNGSMMPVSYWVLVNALDYQTPKVVVLDVFDADPHRKFSGSWGQVHYQFDAFPLSLHKFQMVTDLVNGKTMTDDYGVNVYDKRWELLFDLAEYHTRWNELNSDDFASRDTIKYSYGIWKGAEPLTGVADREPVVDQSYDENTYYDSTSRTYLERIISLCKDRNIELILINTGYDCNAEAKYFHDSVYEIADANDLKYYDFTKEDIIDFDTDLFNSGINTHVNYSGGMKFTDYISNILHTECNLADHRDDINYAAWNDEYTRYIESKNSYLTDKTELIDYLLFLKNDDYIVKFDMTDESILTDPHIADLIDNLESEIMDNIPIDYSEIANEPDDSQSTHMSITVYSRHLEKVIDSRLY